jgi:hypothetical protein
MQSTLFLLDIYRKDGTRFNSIYRISRDELTERIMLRHCVYRFMPTAEYDEYTSPTASTPKTSFQPNLNFSCPFRSRNSQKYQSLSSSTCTRAFTESKFPLRTICDHQICSLLAHTLTDTGTESTTLFISKTIVIRMQAN